MTVKPKPRPQSLPPRVDQTRIEGRLNRHWTDWFGGLTITRKDHGDSILTGPVADQAALSGVSKKVRDLGIPLVSVHGIKPDPANSAKENEP